MRVDTLPPDYLERVYAGVLGKLIGVYLGRPFEGWTYRRILEELEPIEDYVHERLGVPLVVADDDVSGTFTFIRALEEHGPRADLSPQDVAKTWLNAIIERRTILWWGGNGVSTEHTAWLALKRGVKAPISGSIGLNGATVAEQIGAQIFIDGWALVAPGKPQLAARLARAAASVSHDGEAVHAAALLAAMEAEAFLTRDVGRLLKTGLSVVPADCLIAKVANDVRAWRGEFSDWRDARAAIEARYGYDRFPGNCHVVPNHALIHLALNYADGDFGRALTIVNTSGWDTDCNSGNVGCLFAIMLGLDGLDAGRDWRGPLADRALISSADGGYAVNDAVRLAYEIANSGRALAQAAPIEPPKGGAQFHFSLPGSVQGFGAICDSDGAELSVAHGRIDGVPALSLSLEGLEPGEAAAAMTPVFTPPDVVKMRTYDLQASPRLYPGQRIAARLIGDKPNRGAIAARLRVNVYGRDDRLEPIDGPAVDVAPGEAREIEWTAPDLEGRPIQAVGVALSARDERAEGRLWLDRLGWGGAPDVRFRRPAAPGEFWRRAFVNAASGFDSPPGAAFRLSQDRDLGLLITGARDWKDYRVSAAIVVHLGSSAGLVARARGLRRHYALVLARDGFLRLVKTRDDAKTVLAQAPMPWKLDIAYRLTFEVVGRRLVGLVDGLERLSATDETPEAFESGGAGLLIADGALSTEEIAVTPV